MIVDACCMSSRNRYGEQSGSRPEEQLHLEEKLANTWEEFGSDVDERLARAPKEIRRCDLGLLLPASIQPCNTEGVRAPGYFAESDLPHALQHLARLRKTRYRRRQIRIWPLHSRNDRAYGWQHVSEVKPVQAPNHTVRLAEIQNPALTTSTQDPQDLSQPSIVIRQVAKSER